MSDHSKLLSLLPAVRHQLLNKIDRWSICPRFLHRSSVLLHSERVGIMVDNISRLAVKYLPGYDPQKAGIVARVHDDIEIDEKLGDVQACHKAAMTKDEKEELAKKEWAAIQGLAQKFSVSTNGYSYEELLWCAHTKACVESQVVKWCDKLDSCCEALHEILAGNNSTLPMFSQDVIFLNRFTEKYPLVKPLLQKGKHPFINLELRIMEARGGQAKPYTKESIKRETNFPYYDHWKKLILRHLGLRGRDYLARQREFFE